MKLFLFTLTLFFAFQINGFSQKGSLKNVIIEYDTTYEINNVHTGANIGDSYVNNGLLLYVMDGPYSILQTIQKKENGNDGLYMSFYSPSNMPECKGSYTSGEKDKTWYYWKENGKLFKIEHWDMGKLKKIEKIK